MRQHWRFLQKTPHDAFIYLIDETRSYGMERRVQPDFLSDNLPHDFYLYPTNAEVISAWQKLGYTHVLLAATKLETFSMATNERMSSGVWLAAGRSEKAADRSGANRQRLLHFICHPTKIIKRPVLGLFDSINFMIWTGKENSQKTIHQAGRKNIETDHKVVPPRNDHHPARMALPVSPRGEPHTRKSWINLERCSNYVWF